MTRTIPIINGVPNPVIGTIATTDITGQTVIVTNIIRYNGNGRFTCSFQDAGVLRSTPGTYIPSNSGPNAFLVQTAGPNVLRAPNFVNNGVQAELIEPFAVTNSILWSRDLTQAASWGLVQGNVTPVQNAVGLDGTPNSATTLNQTSANSVWGYTGNSSIPKDFNTHTIQFWAKKDNDETRFPNFQSDIAVAGVVTSLNTKTGAFINVGGYGVFTANVYDMGLFWLVVHTLKNNNTIVGNGILVAIGPAKSDILGGNGGHVAGSVVIGNVEIFKNSDVIAQSFTDLWMPVFTTNVPVFRDADLIGTFFGVMDFYFDTIWRAKEYIPERYRDEDGVLKNM